MATQIHNDVKYYSIDRFSERTNLSRSFLYKLMSAGKLPFVTIGRRRLIPREAEDQLPHLCA